MSLFESYEEEIKQFFRQFDQSINSFQNVAQEQKRGELEKIENILNSIEGSLESLNLESNRTGKSTQQYFSQFYQAKKTYQQLKDKYQSEKNYSDLLGSPAYRDFNNSASMTQREKVAKSNKTLEQGISMIRMANDQVNQDKKLAEDTLNNMAQQRERLVGFEKRFDSIDSLLGRARKTLSTMSRREIANKFIMAGIILVLLVSIILIIWLKFVRNSGGHDGSSSDNGSSTTTGPSNSTTTTTTTTTGTTIGTTTGSSADPNSTTTGALTL
ncbi:putative v-SNARE family protein [Cavenderia fasciculata]|uniref:V-SNARE family protein n=1 Tax=Cavenderia fasciculata TaxID=261658 RepID=F4QAR4_CACFS|nr:putative v-SNARE family protein [Cavenderia fasciculata]EGG14982.1 putative v-SNARE family protein [Cavenderia fasciculata]|eukprot:XP_004351702.1 putative v-SNARE family protein [Cavenderia fasciculata]